MNQNYEAVKAHYAASDRKDISAMMAPLTPKTTWIEMAGFPFGGTYIGPDAVTRVFKGLSEKWDGFTFTLERLLDCDKTIIGIGTYSGRFKETGKDMTARVVHVWDMEDGRVVKFEQFTDTKLVAEATK